MNEKRNKVEKAEGMGYEESWWNDIRETGLR